jgi:hypothetical protein
MKRGISAIDTEKLELRARLRPIVFERRCFAGVVRARKPPIDVIRP